MVMHNFNYKSRRVEKGKTLRKITLFFLIIGVLFAFFSIFSHKKTTKPALIPQTTPPSKTIKVIISVDKRLETLERFLKEKDSPLAPYSDYFIEIADKYGLDWTLMPAISGIESNFGKKMSEGSNNPFGLGGRSLITFTNLYDAIEYEGKLLSKDYKLASNRAIGSIYCPQHECNQKWAVTVTSFSEEILN